MAINRARQNAYRAAEDLFERVYFRARLRQFWGRLVGKPCQLKFLDVSMEIDGFSTEEKTVLIDQICGSTGRPDRFDCQFRPLQRRDKGRWTGIAAAMLREPLVLGRVSLIQLGDEYYVTDGHHRVSVARALDKFSVDATVTVWHVGENVENSEMSTD